MDKPDLVKDIKVDDPDELESLLERAYWIEAEFEQSFQWEAYTTLSERHRDKIFRLSHDSQGHKTVLRKIIKNLDGVSMERIEKKASQKDFDFKPGWQDSEIFTEILKYEHLVKDIYTRIKDYTSEELIENIWEKDDPEEFFTTFKYLIEQEEEHVEIVKPEAGKISRIK